MKISGNGTWVSKIDCCKEHQCGSTYMAVQHKVKKGLNTLQITEILTGKKMRIGRVENLSSFESALMWFFFSFFFTLYLYENQSTFKG